MYGLPSKLGKLLAVLNVENALSDSSVRGGMSGAKGLPTPPKLRQARHGTIQVPPNMPLPMNHGVIGSVSLCVPTGSLAQVTSPQVCSVLLTELEVRTPIRQPAGRRPTPHLAKPEIGIPTMLIE
jgi:hypothetical protein